MRQLWLRRACHLLWAGTLLVSGLPATTLAAAAKKSTSSKTATKKSEADYKAAQTLLKSKQSFDKAYKHFSAKRYAEAIALLDVVLKDLNQSIVSTKDRRIRSSSGDLLARSGSLKLACVRAQQKLAERTAKTVKVSGTTTADATPLAPDPSATLGGDADRAPARRPAETGPPFAPLPPAGRVSTTEALRDSNRVQEVTSQSGPFVAPAPPSAIALPGGGDEDVPDEASLEQPALDEGAFDAIEVESNPRVEKWLDYFTGRGRPVFERYLVRSGLYMNWMKGVLEREGVPTDLVHLVFVESGFNPHARSYASAVGPWQFIRGTAKIFGLTVNSWVDERKDPEASTVAAARYLKHLYGLFQSWPLALASYNAGERTVINAIKRQGTKDFWSLRLPRETRDYVPKFMAVLAISRDPARYGFDEVELEDPMTYDEITIPGPVDLTALAEACQVEVEEIRRLNPSFLRNAAPAKNDMVTLRVPDGSGERLLTSLSDGSLSLPRVETPADPVVLRHRVRRGESLNSLSVKYGVPAKKIARYNRIGKKSRLHVGRTILIPQDDGAPRGSTRAIAVRDSSAPSSSDSPVAPGETAEVQVIRVQKGDTLSELAATHGTTVAALRELNGLSRRSVVKAGQRLKVPRAS